MIGRYFAKVLRKTGGGVAAYLADGETAAEGLGSLASEPKPADLRWEIGSITKVFTGILLADMSIRGEVALDDEIGRYLPEATALQLPDDQPTLRHLASHTSGLPRLPMAWVMRARKSDDPYAEFTEDDVFAQLGPKTQLPKRSRRPQYSNFGVGLLGHLLGRAGRGPYAQLVTERILEPLSMADTSFDGEVVAGFRKGKPARPWGFGALGAAGALRSSAGDMLRFAGGVIAPPPALTEAMELARQPVYKARFGIGSVGLGWQLRPRIRSKGTKETVWHNGGTFATSSFLAVDPGARRAVVAFGNRGPGLRSPLDAAGWDLFDSLG